MNCRHGSPDGSWVRVWGPCGASSKAGLLQAPGGRCWCISMCHAGQDHISCYFFPLQRGLDTFRTLPPAAWLHKLAGCCHDCNSGL